MNRIKWFFDTYQRTIIKVAAVWFVLYMMRIVAGGGIEGNLFAGLFGAVAGSYVFALILVAFWVGLTGVYTRVKNTLTNRG